LKTVFYKHKIKKEPTYIILNTFKYKYNGTWKTSILYQDIVTKEIYGRTEFTFNRKFEMV